MNRQRALGLIGLTALGIVLAAGVVIASRPRDASANAGPHPYRYTLTTSACAGCHRAHTATNPSLVEASSIYALCTTCHGGLVSTDVIRGVLQGATNTDGITPRKLNGGGFVQQNGANVTSLHKVAGVPVNGTPWAGDSIAYGSQNGDGVPAYDAGVGVSGVLQCTSCHNPHGSSNYRILNDASTAGRWVEDDPDLLDFVSYQVLATRDDSPNYGFDLTNVNNCPAAIVTYPAGTPTPYGGSGGPGSSCIQRFTSGIAVSTGASGTPTITVPDLTKGMSAFCATCHKSYLTGSGAGHVNSLNTPAAGTTAAIPPYYYPGTQDALDGAGNIARYRHAVQLTRDTSFYPKQPLRFAAIGVDPNPPFTIQYRAMGCLTCHYAHGSSSVQTPAAGTTPEGPAGDSALLFSNNRGVCVACHEDVGSGGVLTPTPAP